MMGSSAGQWRRILTLGGRKVGDGGTGGNPHRQRGHGNRVRGHEARVRSVRELQGKEKFGVKETDREGDPPPCWWVGGGGGGWGKPLQMGGGPAEKRVSPGNALIAGPGSSDYSAFLWRFVGEIFFHSVTDFLQTVPRAADIMLFNSFKNDPPKVFKIDTNPPEDDDDKEEESNETERPDF
uniref:Uncharacterized protein n=1 Tax=Knipowitschia caucasica TaxID=637954 RepID=A0AAV2MP83_KNICA